MTYVVPYMDFFLEKVRRGGGHFRSNKFHCRFFVFKTVYFGPKFWKKRDEEFQNEGRGGARSFNLTPTAPMGGGTQLFEGAHLTGSIRAFVANQAHVVISRFFGLTCVPFNQSI